MYHFIKRWHHHRMNKDEIGKNCKELFKCELTNEFVGISQNSFSFIIMTMHTFRKTNAKKKKKRSKKLKSNKSYELICYVIDSKI